MENIIVTTITNGIYSELLNSTTITIKYLKSTLEDAIVQLIKKKKTTTTSKQ